MKKLVPFILILLSVGLFSLVLKQTNEKIGQPFPGYLTFENGVVGAFYVPDWTGHKEGMTYHAIAPENPSNTSIFSVKDFVLTCVLPAISGLLFVLLGLSIFYYLPGVPGRYPLLGFHLLAGNYLILCPDFHLTYHFSYVLIICFAFIPATVIHFALLFPEEQRHAKKNHWVYWISYILSLIIAIPYIGFFHQPKIWMKIEFVAFFYLILAYFIWLVRLDRTIRQPQLAFNRIIARYLLVGQVAAFAAPLIVGISIFLGKFSFPLNLAAPLAMLLPISLFMGVVLARLRQSQIQLIQSEKNAALGNLLAGLAHEINNPMTFIYSSIEPLREMIAELKNKPNEKTWIDVNELIGVIEEGATRSKDIVESFRYFSHPDQKEEQTADLHSIIEQSLQLLKPKWNHRIEIVRHFGKIPSIKCQTTEMGQVFVNILSNACYAIGDKGTIEISTQADTQWIEISIKDNGHGMSKETLSKIFDAFYTTKPQGDGTGLGLSITLGVVKKYGGTLDVKSELGKGSEFILRLPVKS